MIAIGASLFKFRALFGMKGKLTKVDINQFEHAGNHSRLYPAVAKAWKLVASKYPEFGKKPIYAALAPNHDGFACVKFHDRNIILIPTTFTGSLTEHELVAFYLHELGHLINMRSASIICDTIASYTVLWVRLLTQISWASIVTEIGGDILDRFFASVASFNQEITADMFAASFGYGAALKSGLKKVIPMEEDEREAPSGKSSAGFLTHPLIKKRLADLDYAIKKYFKTQADDLGDRVDETATGFKKRG
jgi:Zn-dependent protease with chaperone function